MSTTQSQEFAPNPAMRPQVVEVGRERSTLIVLDDFMRGAASLVKYAADAAYIKVGDVYPGVRAPAPPGYGQALLCAVAPLMEQTYGAAPQDSLELCAFSLVTTAPGALKPLQRIPHFDGPEPGRFAFIHYLCPPSFGGTSFYRHIDTGYERVTAERLDEYRRKLRGELEYLKPPPGYVRGDTELFERIHSVEAIFNRLIIYQGNALHSGDIGVNEPFTEDPRAGRLTINGFGHLKR